MKTNALFMPAKKIAALMLSATIALPMCATYALPGSAYADPLPKGTIALAEAQEGDQFTITKIAEGFLNNGNMEYKFLSGISWDKDDDKPMPADNGILDYMTETDGANIESAVEGFVSQAKSTSLPTMTVTAEGNISEINDLDPGCYLIEGISSYNGTRTYMPMTVVVEPTVVEGNAVFENPTLAYAKYSINEESPYIRVELRSDRENILVGENVSYTATLSPQSQNVSHGISISDELDPISIAAGAYITEDVTLVGSDGKTVEGAVIYMRENNQAYGFTIDLIGDYNSNDVLTVQYTVSTENATQPFELTDTLKARTLDSEEFVALAKVQVMNQEQLSAAQNSTVMMGVGIVVGIVVVLGAAAGVIYVIMRRKQAEEAANKKKR